MLYNLVTEETTVTKLVLYPSKRAQKLESAGVFAVIIFLTLFVATFFTIVFSKHIPPLLLLTFYAVLLVGSLLFVLISDKAIKNRYKCKRYEITQDQVITYDGVVSCKQRINNMKGMIGMELSEGAIGNAYHYGTITIKFLGGAEVNISNIDNPETYIPKITEIATKGSTVI